MFLVYICLLVLSSSPGWGAESYVPVRQDEIDQSWRWHVFKEFKGQGLRSLAQDSTGAMWFGGERGVVRYDGLTWTAFDEHDGLPSGPINAICTGVDGRVFVASDAGIGYWQDEKWIKVFPKQEGFYWPVDDLEVDRRGRIWAATPWGAVRLGDERPMVYTSKPMATVLRMLVSGVDIEAVPDVVTFAHPRNTLQMSRTVELGNGCVGISIVKGGWLGILRGKHPLTIWDVAVNSPADSAGIVAGDLVISVDQRREVHQRLFAGDVGSVVDLKLFRPSLRDTVTLDLVRKKVMGTVRDWHVYDVMASRDGGIWLGLWDGHVVRFYPDEPTPRWQMWSRPDGLPLQYGPRLHEDRAGSIWRVTNYGGGVYRLQDQTWSLVRDVPFVFGSPITGIAEDGDGRLFLTGGQVAALKDGQWKMPKLDEAQMKGILPNHRNRLLFTNDQSLWLVGLGQGVARLNLNPAHSRVYPELKYQTDHPLSGTWFVAKDSGLVRQLGNVWTRFDGADGLMDRPMSVMVTPNGDVWASGSHKDIAATAHFDGTHWTRDTHPRFSKMVSWKGDFVDSKGRVWFGAYHYDASLGQVGGLLCLDGKKWVHYEPPKALEVVYAMGETTDGHIWAGTHELQYFDGHAWHIDKTLSDVWVHSILGAGDGSLWIGTRLKGVWQKHGQKWRQYTIADGLEGDFFESLIETVDGSIWASGSLGIYRFDGQSWTPDVLPDALFGDITADTKGTLWTVSKEWGAAAIQLEKQAPTVRITSYIDEVAQPGNTLVSWFGEDRWHETAKDDLLYSWRLNDGEWSAYAPEDEHIFLGLSDGAYRLQVSARDKAFNESDWATVYFVVLPPVWKQGWFVGVVTCFLVIIFWQSARVVRRNYQLRQANELLEVASEELQANWDALRTLVDTVPIPIFLQDKAQIFTRCNPAFADLFGKLPKDILGEHQNMIWPLSVAEIEDRTTQSIKETLVIQNYEIELEAHEGHKRKFVISKAPLFERVDDFDGVVAALFDVTERERVEKLTRELERNLVVVQTAGAAAHKINQPLTVVIGMIDVIMESQDHLDDEMKEELVMIRRAGSSIQAIVQAMQATKEYRTEKYIDEVDIVQFDGADEN